MKIKIELKKDRNPYVETLRFKRSGAHVISKKSDRQSAKVALRKAVFERAE